MSTIDTCSPGSRSAASISSSSTVTDPTSRRSAWVTVARWIFDFSIVRYIADLPSFPCVQVRQLRAVLDRRAERDRNIVDQPDTPHPRGDQQSCFPVNGRGPEIGPPQLQIVHREGGAY